MPLLTLKKIIRITSYILFLSIAVLLLLEVSYRLYLIDFYRNELVGLNTPDILHENSQPVILAMGDSFTADPASYVRRLRNTFPDFLVVNSGVPGTCIQEAYLMAPTRIKRFQPKMLIYQIYVGNDLNELNSTHISKDISITRRCFWWLSNKLKVIKYLNFRFRFIRQLLQEEVENGENPKDLEVFSVQDYSPRTKMMFQANPQDLQNCILLKNSRDQDMTVLLIKLRRILTLLPENCAAYIMVIPHCIQLNSNYQQRMVQLGAQINNPDDLLNLEFPFYTRLTTEIKEDNVHFINALPILRRASLLDPVYYENDPHLNAYGQDVLGQHIVDLIKRDQY